MYIPIKNNIMIMNICAQEHLYEFVVYGIVYHCEKGMYIHFIKSYCPYFKHVKELDKDIKSVIYYPFHTDKIQDGHK